MRLPADLTDPELRLWNAIETGEPLSLPRSTDMEREPKDGGQWSDERIIRAEALVEMLIRPRTSDGRPARAVRLSLAKISGSLDLKGLSLLCPLSLESCFFSEAVNLDNAHAPTLTFEDCYLTDITARQLRTRGDLSLEGSRARSVQMDEAHISGRLLLNGAKFDNPTGEALSADGARITGDLFCRGNFKALGEIRMIGAHIGGELTFEDAELTNDKGTALNASEAQVGEGLLCSKFTASGELRLIGTHVCGQVRLENSKLQEPEGRCLSADQAQFDRGLFCVEGFVSTGEISLDNAQISGPLDLRLAQLRQTSDAVSLSLQHATVVHLRLPLKKMPEGLLDFSHAHIAHLEDAWPKTKYTARIVGLAYDTLSPLDIKVSERLEWIKNADGGYIPQPYEQFADLLRHAGQDDSARRVVIAKEKERRRSLGLPGKLRSWFLGATVGYGYKPGRGLWWLTGLAVLDCGIFAWAKADGHFRAIHDKTQLPPQFHLPLYALDHVLPIIELGQRGYWSATGLFQYWQTLSDIAGWVLVTVILGAVTSRLVRS